MSSPEPENRGNYIIARKTIKAKILELKREEEELLRREYENFQRYLQGEKTVPLYAATKQQADRLLKELNGKLREREYPLILRNDTYRIEIEQSPYLLKIPVYGVWGGIRVPIRTHNPITSDMRCKEAKVIHKDNEWFVYICIEKEVEKRIPRNIWP